MSRVGLLGLALAIVPGAAQAQSRDPFEGAPAGPLLRGDVAGARQLPGLAPAGVAVGALRVVPSVSLRMEADSNVLNRATQKRSDVYATVGAGFVATAEAGRATYALQAEAAATRYAQLASQDVETWLLRAQAAASVVSGISLGASGSWTRQVEPAFAPGAAGIADAGATVFDRLALDVAARAEFGRLQVSGGADLTRLDYRPIRVASGPRLDQGFRDQRIIGLTTRAELALGGGRGLFAEASPRWIRSVNPTPCCDRASFGGTVLGGVRGPLSNLVSAEVAVGYQWRNYRSPSLRDYRGAAWRARVEWYATPLVTFAFDTRRDIVNSPLPGAAGVVVDTLSLRALYEVRRELVLILSGAHTRERYRDTAAGEASARGEAAGLEARYRLGRHIETGLFTRYRNRSSDTAALPHQGSAVEGGLSMRFSV